jgi:signal transduction histidine kinase
LSISYNIVQAHKGDLQISSVEGEGTTVTLSLPVTTHHETL